MQAGREQLATVMRDPHAAIVPEVAIFAPLLLGQCADGAGGGGVAAINEPERPARFDLVVCKLACSCFSAAPP